MKAIYTSRPPRKRGRRGRRLLGLMVLLMMTCSLLAPARAEAKILFQVNDILNGMRIGTWTGGIIPGMFNLTLTSPSGDKKVLNDVRAVSEEVEPGTKWRIDTMRCGVQYIGDAPSMLYYPNGFTPVVRCKGVVSAGGKAEAGAWRDTDKNYKTVSSGQVFSGVVNERNTYNDYNDGVYEVLMEWWYDNMVWLDTSYIVDDVQKNMVPYKSAPKFDVHLLNKGVEFGTMTGMGAFTTLVPVGTEWRIDNWRSGSEIDGSIYSYNGHITSAMSGTTEAASFVDDPDRQNRVMLYAPMNEIVFRYYSSGYKQSDANKMRFFDVSFSLDKVHVTHQDGRNPGYQGLFNALVTSVTNHGEVNQYTRSMRDLNNSGSGAWYPEAIGWVYQEQGRRGLTYKSQGEWIDKNIDPDHIYGTFNIEIKDKNGNVTYSGTNLGSFMLYVEVGSTWTISNIKPTTGHAFIDVDGDEVASKVRNQTGYTYDPSSSTFSGVVTESSFTQSNPYEVCIPFKSTLLADPNRKECTLTLVPGVDIYYYKYTVNGKSTTTTPHETEEITLPYHTSGYGFPVTITAYCYRDDTKEIVECPSYWQFEGGMSNFSILSSNRKNTATITPNIGRDVTIVADRIGKYQTRIFLNGKKIEASNNDRKYGSFDIIATQRLEVVESEKGVGSIEGYAPIGTFFGISNVRAGKGYSFVGLDSYLPTSKGSGGKVMSPMATASADSFLFQLGRAKNLNTRPSYEEVYLGSEAGNSDTFDGTQYINLYFSSGKDEGIDFSGSPSKVHVFRGDGVKWTQIEAATMRTGSTANLDAEAEPDYKITGWHIISGTGSLSSDSAADPTLTIGSGLIILRVDAEKVK